MAAAMEKGCSMFTMDGFRSSLLKFMEDLFRHVMQVTEGIESTSGYDFSHKVREYERYAIESGLIPASEYESDFESLVGFETSLGATGGWDHDSRLETASGGHGFDFSDLLHMYDRNLGLSVQRVLTEVAGVDIDRFYQNIKVHIQKRENLNTFLKKLISKFLNASPERELYFLAIISRFFTLLYKSDSMDPKIFIEAIVDTLLESGLDLQLVAINPPEIIVNILENSNNWIRGFRNLSSGNVSDYFPY